MAGGLLVAVPGAPTDQPTYDLRRKAARFLNYQPCLVVTTFAGQTIDNRAIYGRRGNSHRFPHQIFFGKYGSFLMVPVCVVPVSQKLWP